MDDAARERLVSNIVGAPLAGVTEPVNQRAFSYLRNVDKNPRLRGRGRRPGRTALGPAGASIQQIFGHTSKAGAVFEEGEAEHRRGRDPGPW